MSTAEEHLFRGSGTASTSVVLAGSTLRTLAYAAAAISLLSLGFFLLSILNNAFGFVAVRYTRDISAVAPGAESLEELGTQELLLLLEENLPSGVLRRMEFEEPLAQRSRQEIIDLAEARILEPELFRTWTLWESVTTEGLVSAHTEQFPSHRVYFRSWLNLDTITTQVATQPLRSGFQSALIGTIWLVVIGAGSSLIVGVLSAIYLEEFARKNAFNRFLNINIRNLSAIPPVIYGLLGLAFFVQVLGPITGGSAFGAATAQDDGRTLLTGGLTLGLVALPTVVTGAQTVLQSMPMSYRYACSSVGARRWQVVFMRLLPFGLERFLTLSVLAVSRVIGETTPLIVAGAATFMATNPTSPFSKFTALPVQIFFWSTRNQEGFRNLAAGAIVLLLIISLGLNSALVLLRRQAEQSRER
ncbi:MAG: PstA family ABC transporter permease [Spirochaetaceae bacterium]